MNLDNEYKKCVKIIRNLGINVADNYMVLTIDEAPKKKSKMLGVVYYSIKKIFIRVENMSYVDILSTICHEIIHTNPRCHNHGATFKKYASIVNEYFRKEYPDFACGYHEKDHNNCEYTKSCLVNSKYVMYSTFTKEIAYFSNRKTKVWKIVNSCAEMSSRCGYDVKGGDGYSLVALEKVDNGYRYIDRKTSEVKTVKNLDEII